MVLTAIYLLVAALMLAAFTISEEPVAPKGWKPGHWTTDVLLAVTVALWPLAAVLAAVTACRGAR